MEETPKKKILIVDDDGFLLDMYTLKFKQSGFDVDSALGSQIALEKIKNGAHPDILLLDIVMPVMDGFEMLEVIQNEQLIPDAKKIILSNRGEATDIDKGKALGAIGYIVKANTTPSEVITKINDMIK